MNLPIPTTVPITVPHPPPPAPAVEEPTDVWTPGTVTQGADHTAHAGHGDREFSKARGWVE